MEEGKKMGIVTFQEVARYAEKRGKCKCGKNRLRKRKFYQTVSPFNLINGVPKTTDQMLDEIRAEIKAWQAEAITCAACG